MSRSATTSPFVLDVVEEYLRLKAAREPKTYAAYSSVLRGSDRGTKPAFGTALAAYFQNRRFRTLRHDEVSAWFGQRVRGAGQTTKHRISKTARAFFRFSRERGYTDLDLASAIEPFRAGPSRIDWLGWPDIHKLVAAVPEPRYRIAVAWLFGTGARVGEATAALQRDVRWNEDLGVFAWTIPDSKTDAARTVWLSDYLTPYIEASRNANTPRADWPVLWDAHGRGFGRIEDPSSPISPRTINTALTRAGDAAGLPFNVTAHVARHSYATNWIREFGHDEFSIEKLSRQLGTSVANLRKTYIHLHLTDQDWKDVRGFGSL
jgi:integrase